MMKMLVELDENKVLSEGKYSLDKMNSFISNAFKKEKHGKRYRKLVCKWKFYILWFACTHPVSKRLVYE